MTVSVKKILAIDLGKAKSVFCWFDSPDQSHAFKTVASTPQTFHDALVERPVDVVVIEACDMAGWVHDLCLTLGLAIEVINANSDGWRWKHVKNKTDKRDALKMAQLRAAGPLKTVHMPPRPERKYKSLILYRHKLVERRTRVKNTIHALLASEGRAVMGRGAWEPQSLAELRKLATPIGDCTKDDLWPGHLQMELDQLDFLEKEIGKLNAKLDALGDTDPSVIRLQTIPGVGPRLAELVVAVLGDPHRFKSARQVSAYAGLVPRRFQSGEMDRQGRITRAGCGKLRKVLVQVAWGMLRYNARGQAVFHGISKGQKTRRKQAVVALARRVLCWCWAMLRDGTDWREADATEQTTKQQTTTTKRTTKQKAAKQTVTNDNVIAADATNRPDQPQRRAARATKKQPAKKDHAMTADATNTPDEPRRRTARAAAKQPAQKDNAMTADAMNDPDRPQHGTARATTPGKRASAPRGETRAAKPRSARPAKPHVNGESGTALPA